MIFLQDYFNNGDLKSLEAAKANLDYLLGRNPLEYCFVTGFGTKSPQSPHHRPSISDGINKPVPGMLVGGPNRSPASGEGNCNYKFEASAMRYTDQVCSFLQTKLPIGILLLLLFQGQLRP